MTTNKTRDLADELERISDRLTRAYEASDNDVFREALIRAVCAIQDAIDEEIGMNDGGEG
jgi:hypothetical protein